MAGLGVKGAEEGVDARAGAFVLGACGVVVGDVCIGFARHACGLCCGVGHGCRGASGHAGELALLLALLVGALGHHNQDQVERCDGNEGRDGVPVAQQLACDGFDEGDHEQAPLPHMPAT
jgi:hypothetical protein